jgi:hypothetical protein
MPRPLGSTAPHTWKSGPDPVEHDKYTAWSRARAQAHFRGEAWELTWPEWQQAWGDQWQRRGRTHDSLMLTRIDPLGAWKIDNVHLIDRRSFGRWQRQQVRIKRGHSEAV